MGCGQCSGLRFPAGGLVESACPQLLAHRTHQHPIDIMRRLWPNDVQVPRVLCDVWRMLVYNPLVCWPYWPCTTQWSSPRCRGCLVVIVIVIVPAGPIRRWWSLTAPPVRNCEVLLEGYAVPR